MLELRALGFGPKQAPGNRIRLQTGKREGSSVRPRDRRTLSRRIYCACRT